MDISKITNEQELEALGYRQVLLLEQAQANLRLIQTRLAQLRQEKEKPSD